MDVSKSPPVSPLNSEEQSELPCAPSQHLIGRKPVAVRSTESYVSDERNIEGSRDVDGGSKDENENDHPQLKTPRWTIWKSSRQSLLRTWWAEAISCTVSLMMLVAMMSILITYRNRPIPSLPFNISFNAVISVLTTVMKACVLMAVAEGLGQLKWYHFTHRRILQHLVTYDTATRGPWGSIKLLATLRPRSLLPTAGAVLTILVIAVDPFSQQLIRYYPCEIAASNGSVASIPRSTLYAETGRSFSSESFQASIGQISAVVGACFYPELIEAPFQCRSGTCKFEEIFTTIDFCTECIDVTNELSITTRNQPGALNGDSIYIETSLGGRITVTSRQYEDSLFFAMNAMQNKTRTQDLIVEMALAATQEKADSPLPHSEVVPAEIFGSHCYAPWQKQSWGCRTTGAAARCTIKPCVNAYNVSINAGILSEKLLQSYDDWFYGRPRPGRSSVPQERQLTMADLSCVDDATRRSLKEQGFSVTSSRFMPYNVTISVKSGKYTEFFDVDDPEVQPSLRDDQLLSIPNTCIYTIHEPSWEGISTFMQRYFTANASVSTNRTSFVGNEQALKILNDTYVSLDSINRTFQAIGTALSARARQWRWNDSDIYSQPFQGITTLSETCVGVRWAWIIYPATITFSTMAFFIMVVLLDMKMGIDHRDEGGFARGWKSSLLPLLYHGLDEMEDDEWREEGRRKLYDIREMNRMSVRSTAYLKLKNSPEGSTLL